MGRCCPVAGAAETNEASCPKDDVEFFVESVGKGSHEGAKPILRDGGIRSLEHEGGWCV